MSRRRVVAVSAGAMALVACGGDESPSGPEWVGDVREAVAAVEGELGGAQDYFEVTATPQLTNVFVAADGGATAIPFVYVDDALGPAGAPLEVEQGQTFTAAAITFDDDLVLAAVSEELPDSAIDAFSVEGGPDATVRYVVSVRSPAGGVLDVVVAADGTVISVNPL